MNLLNKSDIFNTHMSMHVCLTAWLPVWLKCFAVTQAMSGHFMKLFVYISHGVVGYPADEAASYEQLVYRQQAATQLFLGYFEDNQLCGVSSYEQLVYRQKEATQSMSS